MPGETFAVDTTPICHAHQAITGEYVEGHWFAEMTVVGLPGFLCNEHSDMSVVPLRRVVLDPDAALEDEGDILGTPVALNASDETRRQEEARVEAANLDAELSDLLNALGGGQPYDF